MLELTLSMVIYCCEVPKIGDLAVDSLNFSRLISERSGRGDDVSSISQGGGPEWGRAGDSRALTSEHDSRFIPARRSICDGHCVERAKANPERAKKHHSCPQLKLHITPSVMTMKRSRNCSAPLLQASAVETMRFLMVALHAAPSVPTR
jgi:hypothetical protein